MSQKHRKPNLESRKEILSKKAAKREEHEKRPISSFPAFLIHLQSVDSNESIVRQSG
jgi:hypothetical protein